MNMITKSIIFGLVTIFILIITLVAQRERRTWAWARFFVFELNLALILISLHLWIVDPFSPLQIASWIVLLASLYLVFTGVFLLIKRGKPKGHFEKTTELVVSGVYRFIRHPMYASLAYLTVGILLKNPSPPTLVLGALALIAAILTARVEERDNLAKFGPAYRDYMKKTKMFVPYVF
jgi:protein-S-isoprenylcysteine O-methyltransferase Ste14